MVLYHWAGATAARGKDRWTRDFHPLSGRNGPIDPLGWSAMRRRRNQWQRDVGSGRMVVDWGEL